MVESVTRLAEMMNHNPEEPHLDSSDRDQGLLTDSRELRN
jgi:hypothetical protein